MTTNSELIKYFDAHSHLNFKQFDDDREELIKEMRERGIYTITVGTDLTTSKEAIALAEKHEHIYATVGIHPTDVLEHKWDGRAFSELVVHLKVVAIGECGLDYFRLNSEDVEVRDRQKELFEQQIAFAHVHDLPLMIHGRPSTGSMDAYEDILDTLEEQSEFLKEQDAGDVHFFVGTPQVAERFLALGFTLSFDGPVTFSDEYNEVIKMVPQDKILAETDAPFATPAPHRGQRNQPSYVGYVITRLAEIRGEDVEELRQATVVNTQRVFSISGQ